MARELTVAEYEKVLAKAKAKGMSEDDVAQILAESDATAPGLGAQAKDLGGKALDKTLKVLDVTGGLTRKGIGELAGVENLPSVEDIVTLQKSMPMTEDMLKQEKIMEDYPGMRKALGFAGDVVADPVTLLTLGGAGLAKTGAKKLGSTLTKTAAKASPYIDPMGSLIGAGVQKLGKPLYKSGVKQIETRLAEKGGDEITPYLMKQDIWGRPASIEKGIEKRIGQLGEARAPIYEQIEKAGKMVDPYEASQPALEYLAKLEANPYAAPQVSGMLDTLGLANKPMSVSQASRVKSEMYGKLPASAYDTFGRLTSEGQKLNKALARGYKEAIEQAGERTAPGLGGKIANINDEMGTLISAQKPAASEVAKAGRKDLGTAVDALLLGGSPGALVTKKIGEGLKSSSVKTGLGLLAHKRAAKPAESQIWKQILLGTLGQGEE